MNSDNKTGGNDAGAITNLGYNSSLLQNLINQRHTPDILDCIANLSNDEVFTPPEFANKVLDLLPEEVWHDKNLKWLDPACKTGIFLRQIAVRLMEGLRDEFPDEEERRRHIFQNMLYGIAITNLTALMSRRSLYTSKDAGGEKSIAGFTNKNGNISYDNRPHTYKNGSCIFCGNAENSELDRDETLERHAYNFIHLTPEEAQNMKFDVIVGNPPYQLGDGGGGGGSSASPIYQLFVRQAKKLNPKYLAFIIPSRWFVGGKGLDDFRDEMMHDHSIKTLVDYPNSNDCFPGVEIKGGVCYFVRQLNYDGLCDYSIMNENDVVTSSKRFLDEGNAGVVIRYPEMVSILTKVQDKHEKTMSNIVSSRKPYGLTSDFFKNPNKYDLPPIFKNDAEVSGASVRIYGLEGARRAVRYASLGYPFPSGEGEISGWKLFVPKAYGGGAVGETFPDAIIASPRTACTETFLRVGHWNSEEEAKNALKYLKTKFSRILLSIKKTTQNTAKDTYSLLPLLDFTEEWSDEKLYQRYRLSQKEINFIEKNAKEAK